MKIQTLVLVAIVLSIYLAPLRADEPPTSRLSRTVGSVYGKSLTAADIGLTTPIDVTINFDSRDTELWQLMKRITQAFGKPISDRFVQEHNIAATKKEISAFKKSVQEHHQKQLLEIEDQIKRMKAELAKPGLLEEERAKVEKNRRVLESILPTQRHAAAIDFHDIMAKGFVATAKIERELHQAYGGRVIFQQGGLEAIDARRRLYEEAEKKGDLVFNDAGVRHLFYYYSNMKHVVVDEKVLKNVWPSVGKEASPTKAIVPTRKTLTETVGRFEQRLNRLNRRVASLERSRSSMPQPEPTKNLPKAPPAEKQWVYEDSTEKPLQLAPRQIIPVESGVWFGSSFPGSKPSPLGFLDLNQGHVTLLIESGSANWSAVGTEAIAVQLDRKSLIRLSSADLSVATWDQRPEGCNYFSQVEAYKDRFCIGSPFNPLWVFDPWLKTWKKIELERVNDADSAKFGADYYRPTIKRFAISPDGDLWGFQGTLDATRGNAVCHYLPGPSTGSSKWEQTGFPWATARGEDRIPIGVTDTAVWFVGRSDVLLYDIKSRQWNPSPIRWPERRLDWATFTPHGVLFPVDNMVQRFVPESSTWESIATLKEGDRVTAIAMLGDTLYLATASGIHVLNKTDAHRFGETTFYPWKYADQVKIYKAVLQ